AFDRSEQVARQLGQDRAGASVDCLDERTLPFAFGRRMVALFDPRLRLAHRLVESGGIDGRVPAADDSFEVEDEREQAGLATLAFEPGELGQRLGRVDLDADLLALDPEAVGLAQEANGEAAGDREARAIGKLSLEP